MSLANVGICASIQGSQAVPRAKRRQRHAGAPRVHAVPVEYHIGARARELRLGLHVQCGCSSTRAGGACVARASELARGQFTTLTVFLTNFTFDTKRLGFYGT